MSSKLKKALKQTGGVRDLVDRESIETFSDDELRKNLFASRDDGNASIQEAIANDNRRTGLMHKMGFDFFDIESIDPHPENNYSLDEQEIRNLAAAIHESGVTTPIVIREKKDGRFELLGGERRWRAHRFLADQYGDAWRMIPGRNMGAIDDEQALFILHSDNLNQRELTPSERAYGFKVIYDRISKQRMTDPAFQEKYRGKKTYDILAEQFHVSSTTVKNEVAISSNLSEEAKEMLDSGKLAKKQAIAMSRMSEDDQDAIMDEIGDGDLTNEQIDAVIEQVKAGEGVPDETTLKRQKDATVERYLKSARGALRKALKSPGDVDYAMIGQIKNLIKEIESR